MMLKSIELRARRDGIIHHDEVQALLTVLGVDGGEHSEYELYLRTGGKGHRLVEPSAV